MAFDVVRGDVVRAGVMRAGVVRAEVVRAAVPRGALRRVGALHGAAVRVLSGAARRDVLGGRLRAAGGAEPGGEVPVPGAGGLRGSAALPAVSYAPAPG
ncbi:hypothetical protein PQR15_22370 [Streptomyces lydicus]|nr:hypothetical protein [Streptomyces lydicus]